MRATLRDISDFTVSVLEGMDTAAFPADRVLSLLGQALDAESAVFQRTDRRSGATVVVPYGCRPAAVPLMIEMSRTRWPEHPHIAAAARGDLAPSTGQQAAGGFQPWRRSVARAFLEEIGGWDHQVTVPLHGGPVEICALSFARPGPDFGGETVALLTAVQPLLQAVERHAALVARWTGDPACAHPARAARDAGLTARELDVLVLMGQGLTATAAARRLVCSPRTVQKHTANLYRKLGVCDRVTALLEAQRRQILPHPAASRTASRAATSDLSDRTAFRDPPPSVRIFA